MDNITFTCKQLSEICTKNINQNAALNVPIPIFRIETCYMNIYSSSFQKEEPESIFILTAKLQIKSQDTKIQHLKLKTDCTNTYLVSLASEFSYKKKREVRLLVGRNTEAIREEARKQLLVGLSVSDYSCSIEEARVQILEEFSKTLLERLFPDTPKLVQDNTLKINTWLIKLLG